MEDKTNNREKFLKDRELPTAEEISNYKNFDKVLKCQALAKSILVKKVFIWSTVVLVATTTSLVVYFSGKDKGMLRETQAVKKESIIDLPVPGKEIPFTAFMIDASVGGEITCNNTIITIHPNCFIDSKGHTVSDSVMLLYREFFNPLDVFLSGIPMKYDSAGVSYTFETAGMFQVGAFKGNEKLTLASGKPIDIKMPFTAGDNYFNFYSLDDSTGKWDYISRNVVKGEQPVVAENNRVNTRDFSTDESSLLTPQKDDPAKYNFKFEANTADFPELNAYEEIEFEVLDNNSFSKNYYKINWDNVIVNSTNTKGVFNLKLVKADTAIYVDVKPVFSDKNYDAALKAFEKQQQDVSKKNTMEELEKERKLNSVNNKINSSNTNDALISARSMMNINNMYSVIRISRFGTYNCDFPIPPSPLARTINFIQDNRTKDVTLNNNVYMIEKGKNALFKFSSKEPLRYDPMSENLAWVLTGKNEFVFLDLTTLDKPEVTISSATLILVPQEQALEKIKQFIN